MLQLLLTIPIIKDNSYRMMSNQGLFGKRADYLEIGEYNFSWPGYNGSLHDFGSINYTMPTGEYYKHRKI